MNCILLSFILLILSKVLAAVEDEIHNITLEEFSYKDEMTKVLDNLGLDANTILENTSEACLISIENTHACFQTINNLIGATYFHQDKYEEICNVYYSQGCKYFREYVVDNKNSGCNNQYDQMYFRLNFDVSEFYFISLCYRKPNFTYCPASFYYRSVFSNDISQTSDSDKELIYKHSKVNEECTEQIDRIIDLTPSVFKAFDLIYPVSNQTQESLDKLKSVLDITFLKDQLNTSNAITNKISLISTAIIMLLSFLILV